MVQWLSLHISSAPGSGPVLDRGTKDPTCRAAWPKKKIFFFNLVW